MPIFKYLTAENGLRYLHNWHLKYSLPSEFNDPFDVRPSIEEEEARTLFSRALQIAEREGRLSNAPPSSTHHSVKASSIAEGMQGVLDRANGVLCLTRTSKHLLMWAHYADCHKGLLLEFDENHECFNRSDRAGEMLGRLYPVQYSDERPSLSGAGVMPSVFLSKSLEWAHEQEMRLLWPASKPDFRIDQHLLYAIPPAALRRVILGCRASETTRAMVAKALAAESKAASVKLQEAKLREREFSLDYRTIQLPFA